MVRRWRILANFCVLCFSASRVQHTSDLHSKFAKLRRIRKREEKELEQTWFTKHKPHPGRRKSGKIPFLSLVTLNLKERKKDTIATTYNGLPYAAAITKRTLHQALQVE